MSEITSSGALSFNLEHRTFLINDHIDDKIVQSIIIEFHHLLEEDKKVKEPEPIKFMVNSPGGYVTPAMSLIQMMITSATPIHTYNVGACCSAAFLIFIAGEKRFTTKYNYFMDHDIQAGAWGRPGDMEKQVANTKKLGELIQNYITTRTKLTAQDFKKRTSDEEWWLGEQAITLGIATDLY